MSEIPERNLAPDELLFGRVATILEHARSNVIRTVNSNMVIAYWLIGSEIVQALQGGEDRAEYGKQVLLQLSQRLAEQYGKGFSLTTLRYFRAFYLAYADRHIEIQHPVGAEFETPAQSTLKQRPMGAESSNAFNPQLSWSHYRVLMRVHNLDARSFYEREAIAGGWDMPLNCK